MTMDNSQLKSLEKAVEHYRRAGYSIISQTGSSITLAAPPQKFSYLFFILALIMLWPVAIIYLIIYNRRGSRIVCARTMASGDIEISGFTLKMLKKEKRRQMILIVILPLAILMVTLLIYVLGKQGR